MVLRAGRRTTIQENEALVKAIAPDIYAKLAENLKGIHHHKKIVNGDDDMTLARMETGTEGQSGVKDVVSHVSKGKKRMHDSDSPDPPDSVSSPAPSNAKKTKTTHTDVEVRVF